MQRFSVVVVLLDCCKARSFVGTSKVRSSILAKKNTDPTILLTNVFSFLAIIGALSLPIAACVLWPYFICGARYGA